MRQECTERVSVSTAFVQTYPGVCPDVDHSFLVFSVSIISCAKSIITHAIARMIDLVDHCVDRILYQTARDAYSSYACAVASCSLYETFRGFYTHLRIATSAACFMQLRTAVFGIRRYLRTVDT